MITTNKTLRTIIANLDHRVPRGGMRHASLRRLSSSQRPRSVGNHAGQKAQPAQTGTESFIRC